jgi:hypothetical protein
LDVASDHSLLDESAEDETPNSSKPVNSNFHWHSFRLSSISGSITINEAGNANGALPSVNEEFLARRVIASGDFPRGVNPAQKRGLNESK